MKASDRLIGWVTAVTPVGTASYSASQGNDPISGGAWLPFVALIVAAIGVEIILLGLKFVIIPNFTDQKSWLGQWVSIEKAGKQISIFTIRWSFFKDITVKGVAYSSTGIEEDSWESDGISNIDPREKMLKYSYRGKNISRGKRNSRKVVGFCIVDFRKEENGVFVTANSSFFESNYSRAKGAISENADTRRVNKKLLDSLGIHYSWIPFFGISFDKRLLVERLSIESG